MRYTIPCIPTALLFFLRLIGTVGQAGAILINFIGSTCMSSEQNHISLIKDLTKENSIPPNTRSNIFDGLRINNVNWCGSLNEVDFLSRIFNLKSLPSTDLRMSNAEGDIYQHCIRNADWEHDWVYGDPRFNLLESNDDIFLKFLCEIVHPVVRSNQIEAKEIVDHFNEQLMQCGWQIIENELIQGRAKYKAMHINADHKIHIKNAKIVAASLNSEWMNNEINRMETALENNDPALAIGTAKEFVESICKSILNDYFGSVDENMELPKLVNKTLDELKLTKNQIPDQVKSSDTIKKLLGNLSSLTLGLATLRNTYGTGHGKASDHSGLEVRHARLAVGAAIVFVRFIFDTYKKHGAKSNV